MRRQGSHAEGLCQRAAGWCEAVQVLHGITLEQAAEPFGSR